MSKIVKVFHLDDDLFFLDRLKDILKNNGTKEISFVAESFSTPEIFIKKIQLKPQVHIIVLDIRLSSDKYNGKMIVNIAKNFLPKVPIIMCSDLNDIKTVVECIQLGAQDFIFKNSTDSQLVLRLYGIYLHKCTSEISVPKTIDGLFAGKTIKNIAKRIPKIVQSAITSVHIYGETGTGKEVVATLFKEFLPKKTPFHAINCGAIPETLIESELFGHVKGAFTGAQFNKVGYLESASGGWVFLDEIASLSQSAQAALLRVLENKMIRPVGSSTEKPIDINVISATNESLDLLAEKGAFRKDLWQRLCETTINLPPLRERPEEIPDIIENIIKNLKNGPFTISDPAIKMLTEYNWIEGNIRELRNTLRAMTELNVEGELTPLSIPRRIWDAIGKSWNQDSLKPKILTKALDDKRQITLTWDEPEKPDFPKLQSLLLIAIIKKEYQSEGKLTLRQLSRNIGIPRSTLSTRLKELIYNSYIEMDQLSTFVGLSNKADIKE